MSLTALTGLAYHSQDSTTYCGAAVEQMILRPFKALFPQVLLATQNSAPGNPSNGVLVDGLVRTLNSHIGSRPGFAAARNALLSVAVTALQQSKTGVAARILDGAHWAVYNGVVLELDGSSSPRGFYIHDPHAEVSQNNGHKDGDECGTNFNLGMPNEYYTLAGMERFSKGPVDLVCFKGQPVINPAFGTQVSIEGANTSRLTSTGQFGPAEMANRGIAADGIADRGPLCTILTGYRCGAVLQVATVRGWYWSVSLRVNSNRIGCALIDPHNGELLAVMVSGKEPPLMDLSPQSVQAELQKNANLIAAINPRFAQALTERLAPVQASFFWDLCREAPSPSQPLVQLRIRDYVLYRAYNGTFHTNLTPLDR
jgi:hypothetical protein